MRMPFADTLRNLLSRLGTAADKTTHAEYTLVPMNKSQLDMAYRGDWIARKVVDIPAQDSTREWRAWQADEADTELIEELEKKFFVQQKLKQAMVKARLYGGGAIIMGVDGAGEQDKELNLDRVGKDSLKFLHVVGRWDLTAGPLEGDLMSPSYGLPTYYERSPTLTISTANIQQLAVRIHPSRVIRIQGSELPDITLSSDGWADSALQVVDDACRAAGLVSQSGATLVQEMTYDIVKIPGLTAGVSTDEYESNLLKRFTYSNNAKSVINAILLDKEEEWERITTSLAGLPDVLKLYLLIASGAADIPATRMLGQSPTGLSATGESDIRNHYDRISSDQKTTVTPAMTPLDEVIIRSALGSRPPEVHYSWNSLWQLDDVESATRDKAHAEAFKIDVDTALINPDALRQARINQLIEDGTYPGLQDAIDEFGDVPEEPEGQFDPVTGLPTDPTLQAAAKLAAGAAAGTAADPKAKAAANENKLFGQSKAAADAILIADARARFADAYDPGQERDPTGQWTSGKVEVTTHSAKSEAIAHARTMRSEGHEAKVFRHEQNITHASRGAYASQIGGEGTSKAVHFTVEVKRKTNDSEVELEDASPRTVYLRRDVLNAAAILRHYADQGVGDLYSPASMHVTIMFSKTPIDWMKLGEADRWGDDSKDGKLRIPPGGIRLTEAMGEPPLLALLFTSNALSYRHMRCIDAGCEYKWEDYQPHVTVARSVPSDLKPEEIVAWQGPIELGPEVIEEVNPDWRSTT